MFSIQRFKVKNFRAFRESAAVELKPLTVFAGANSSGKSSFTQGLLLLKQSLETESFPRLQLTGRPELFVEFSRFEDAVFKYAPPERNQLGFEIRVTGFMPERRTCEFFRGELPQPINVPNKKEIRFPLTLDVDITFRYDEKWGAIVDRLDCQASSGSAVGPRLVAEPIPDGEDQRSFVSAVNDWSEEDISAFILAWSGILPIGSRLTREKKNSRVDRIADELTLVLNPLFWLSEELRSRFSYLGPLRSKPQLLYHIDPNPPLKINAQDDSAYQRLWYARDETVQLIAPGHEPSELPLAEALNRILESLGIAHSISIVPVGALGFQIRFQTIDGQESVSIPHVGFGVSQILPVLLICLEARQGDTIIVDHPEIHLHPDIQARMADYFIELANAGRRVIVETQSQYFIRRLVRRTAEREDLVDKINILFVRRPRGKKGATIAPLEVNQDGDISNWPSDFFPEPDEDTAKTLDARFRRGQQ
jgi:hypothetical protein